MKESTNERTYCHFRKVQEEKETKKRSNKNRRRKRPYEGTRFEWDEDQELENFSILPRLVTSLYISPDPSFIGRPSQHSPAAIHISVGRDKELTRRKLCRID